jgi:hypothetical protein
MDFRKLINRGKKVVEDRGGVEALKADAKELRDIAKGEGKLSDKAKAAAAALKDEGAKGQAPEPSDAPEGQAEPSAPPPAVQGESQPATSAGDPPAAS